MSDNMIVLKKQNFEENKQLYKKVYNYLKKSISEELDIHHVGSTAIPNMYGKNIIDILIGAKNKQEFKVISNKLLELGYHTKKDDCNDIYKFFASKKEETASGDIHIHLVIMNSDRYRQFLHLRNYLLSNTSEAKKYSDFKLRLINSGIKNRKEYKKIKSEYVNELIKKMEMSNDSK